MKSKSLFGLDLPKYDCNYCGLDNGFGVNFGVHIQIEIYFRFILV